MFNDLIPEYALEAVGIYNVREAIREIDEEYAEECSFNNFDDEIFDQYALESGMYLNLLDYAEESDKEGMSKKEFMSSAKKKALDKFKKSSRYKKVTSDMSKAERDELDRRLNREMDRREHEADSIWVKHPYVMSFICLFFLGIIGAFIATYYLDKHSEARARYNNRYRD